MNQGIIMAFKARYLHHMLSQLFQDTDGWRLALYAKVLVQLYCHDCSGQHCPSLDGAAACYYEQCLEEALA